MKIVGVVRVLNEDDIIESVIRHHLAQLDYVIALDDGSNDHTIEIIEALKNEGLPVELLKSRCVISDESNRNTFLFQRAKNVHSANWVVFFDADEFIDARLAKGGLREYLGSLPADWDGIYVPLVNYIAAASDNAAELVVPKRMVWRHKHPPAIYKLIVRTRHNVSVSAGNHNAWSSEKKLEIHRQENVLFAHFYRRSDWHELYKSVIGRLKVLAAGQRELSKGTSCHYIQNFNAILEKPDRVINNSSFSIITPDPKTMEINPIVYLGGGLRYTKKTDYKMKFISMILKYGCELAGEVGHLMDTNVAVRERILTRVKPNEPST